MIRHGPNIWSPSRTSVIASAMARHSKWAEAIPFIACCYLGTFRECPCLTDFLANVEPLPALSLGILSMAFSLPAASPLYEHFTNSSCLVQQKTTRVRYIAEDF